jgi:hypothetical protein
MAGRGVVRSIDCPALDVVANDGTSWRHVTDGSKPQWTPDDSQIVFLDGNGRLRAVGADGLGPRMVSNHFVTSFSLTSDSQLIAYSREACTRTTCTGEIWIARTDGRGRWPLLRNSIDADPAWRPG